MCCVCMNTFIRSSLHAFVWRIAHIKEQTAAANTGEAMHCELIQDTLDYIHERECDCRVIDAKFGVACLHTNVRARLL